MLSLSLFDAFSLFLYFFTIFPSTKSQDKTSQGVRKRLSTRLGGTAGEKTSERTRTRVGQRRRPRLPRRSDQLGVYSAAAGAISRDGRPRASEDAFVFARGRGYRRSRSRSGGRDHRRRRRRGVVARDCGQRNAIHARPRATLSG